MQTSEKFNVDKEILASSGQRFGNYFIDVIVIYLIIIILTFIIGVITQLSGLASFVEWAQNINDFEGYIVFFLVMIPYYTFFESYTSRTVGKYITKTMVVLKDGSKASSQTILKRTICRIIPFEALSFLSSHSRGWHDTISDTYVVKKDLFERKRELLFAFDEIGKSNEEI